MAPAAAAAVANDASNGSTTRSDLGLGLARPGVPESSHSSTPAPTVSGGAGEPLRPKKQVRHHDDAKSHDGSAKHSDGKHGAGGHGAGHGGHGGGHDHHAAEIDEEIMTAKIFKDLPWYSRRKLRHIVNQERFHQVVIGLVIFDLVLVFIDLILAISSSCVPNKEVEIDSSNATESSTNSTESTSTNLTETPGALAAVAAAAQKSLTGLFRSLEEAVTGANTTVVEVCSNSPSLKESASLETAKSFLFWLSVVLLIIFALEVFLNIYAKGTKWFKSPVAVIDGIIVYGSLFMELYFHFSGLEESSAGGIVVLRIWKMVRAMHAIAHSVEMKNQAIIHAVRRSNHVITRQTEDMCNLFNAKKQEFLALKRRVNQAYEQLNNQSDESAVVGQLLAPPAYLPAVSAGGGTSEDPLQLHPVVLSRTLKQLFAALEVQLRRMQRAVDRANADELKETMELTQELDEEIDAEEVGGGAGGAIAARLKDGDAAAADEDDERTADGASMYTVDTAVSGWTDDGSFMEDDVTVPDGGTVGDSATRTPADVDAPRPDGERTTPKSDGSA